MSKTAGWKKRAQAEVKCPSGEMVTIRRVPKEALLTCGHVPAPLMEKVIKAYKVADEQFGDGQPSLEQLLAMPDIVDATLIACLVEPRAVAGEPGEDEINVRDIPAEDRVFLFTEAQKSFPQIPVQTEGGETTLQALTDFHSEGGLPSSMHESAAQGATS